MLELGTETAMNGRRNVPGMREGGRGGVGGELRWWVAGGVQSPARAHIIRRHEDTHDDGKGACV